MENITKEQWKELTANDKNAVIIDVRTPGECAEGFIEGAQQINLMDPGFQAKMSELNKDQTYYVYCRSGNRSGQACSIMDQMGFNKTYNLIGGMLMWDGEVVYN